MSSEPVLCVAVIPQTCWYNQEQFDCGLSLSCVLEGGRPLDLCSGGLIWSCCVAPSKVETADPNVGALENASRCFKQKRISTIFIVYDYLYGGLYRVAKERLQ